MKKRFIVILGIFASMIIGNSCDPDTGECDADPDVCACIENPLRCVSPVGTTEEQSDDVETISEVSVKE